MSTPITLPNNLNELTAENSSQLSASNILNNLKTLSSDTIATIDQSKVKQASDQFDSDIQSLDTASPAQRLAGLNKAQTKYLSATSLLSNPEYKTIADDIFNKKTAAANNLTNIQAAQAKGKMLSDYQSAVSKLPNQDPTSPEYQKGKAQILSQLVPQVLSNPYLNSSQALGDLQKATDEHDASASVNKSNASNTQETGFGTGAGFSSGGVEQAQIQGQQNQWKQDYVKVRAAVPTFNFTFPDYTSGQTVAGSQAQLKEAIKTLKDTYGLDDAGARQMLQNAFRVAPEQAVHQLRYPSSAFGGNAKPAPGETFLRTAIGNGADIPTDVQEKIANSRTPQVEFSRAVDGGQIKDGSGNVIDKKSDIYNKSATFTSGAYGGGEMKKEAAVTAANTKANIAANQHSYKEVQIDNTNYGKVLSSNTSNDNKFDSLTKLYKDEISAAGGDQAKKQAATDKYLSATVSNKTGFPIFGTNYKDKANNIVQESMGSSSGKYKGLKIGGQ